VMYRVHPHAVVQMGGLTAAQLARITADQVCVCVCVCVCGWVGTMFSYGHRL